VIPGCMRMEHELGWNCAAALEEKGYEDATSCLINTTIQLEIHTVLSQAPLPVVLLHLVSAFCDPGLSLFPLHVLTLDSLVSSSSLFIA
jgi:hypothetical protein